jgi:methylated-DNA-protein-cysteine methyltransferase-like protein
MPRPKSIAFARIRAEVIRLVALIPEGKFTTYGSLAVHMNVAARHVAFVLSSLTDEEAAVLPWHRVVGAEGRISPNMPPAVARKQRSRLRAEGLKFDARGFIKEPDAHFDPAGPRRGISWSQTTG